MKWPAFIGHWERFSIGLVWGEFVLGLALPLVAVLMLIRYRWETFCMIIAFFNWVGRLWLRRRERKLRKAFKWHRML